uniref:N-acetyltransferase domain-containing protein n=1 Tax=Meloidogyne hapla TaxID=6305 RepID=A0A1I8BCH9_MELHA
MVKQPETALINGQANGFATKNGILNGKIANGTNISNGHLLNDQQIKIRSAKPDDAKALRSLIQELADHQDMPDGPRISAEQIAQDFNSGFMHSLVAFGSKGEMAAYALYYLPGSSTQGQIMHLEDLYIRPQFRRRGIGLRLLRELEKIANAQHLPFLEWQVLRSNHGAIHFYKTLPGLIDETDGKEVNKSIFWRLSAHAFGHVLRKAAKQEQKENKDKLIMEVHLDECSGSGQISERNAFHLADQWHSLVNSPRNGEIIREELEEENNNERKAYKFLNRRSLAKLINSGLLGAIVVRKEQKAIEERNKIVGMAFFHRKSYSTWQGRFPVLDNIFVVDSARRKGIGTAIMAELVKIAHTINATKIQWDAHEPTAIVSMFHSSNRLLNADNLTDDEGWLLYRWYYNQQKQYSTNGEMTESKENGVSKKNILNGC